MTQDAAGMTDADALESRSHGFSDREIMDITLAAAAGNYLSPTLLALAVDLDVPPSLSAKPKVARLPPLASSPPA